MKVRKIALGAALALPLTALVAGPAYAGGESKPDKDKYEKPSISIEYVDAEIIKKVVVHKYDDGSQKKVVRWEYPAPVVTVDYTCYTKQDKHMKGEKVKYGTIEAVLKQKKAERSGEAKAKCDGEPHSAKVVLYKGDGNLKQGDAKVKVEITDPHDKTAKAKDKDAEVELIVKKKVIKH